MQRLAGNPGRVASRDRYQHPIGLGFHSSCRFQALGTVISDLHSGAALGEQLVHFFHSIISGCFVLAKHYYDQIVGSSRLDFRSQQVALSKHVFICVRTHDHPSIQHTGLFAEGALQLHQDDGIIICTGSNFNCCF